MSSLVSCLLLSLQVIDKLLDLIPTKEEAIQNRIADLKRRYIKERAMPTDQRSDRQLDQIVEELSLVFTQALELLSKKK